MRTIASLYLLLQCFSLVCQKQYTTGYFIDNQGKTTKCHIKNIGARNNPIQINFKLNGDSKVQTASMAEVAEFGVGDLLFRRYEVPVDRSGDDLSQIGNSKLPTYQVETIYLKQLIPGAAVLYAYVNQGVVTYYYSLDGADPKPLTYNRYRKADNSIATNNAFRHQLITDLACDDLSFQDVQNTSYTQSDLSNFFVKYNQCVDPDYSFQPEVLPRSKLHVHFRPGVLAYRYDTQSTMLSRISADFGKQTGFRVGMEFEWYLALPQSQWAVVVEPTYATVNFKEVDGNFIYVATGAQDTDKAKAHHHTVGGAIGLRRYFQVSNSNGIFIDATSVLEIPLDSSVEFENFDNPETGSTFHLALGLGLSHKEKLKLQARYGLKRNPLKDELNWSSSLSSLELTFSYRILGLHE